MPHSLTRFLLGVRAIAALPSWRAQQSLIILSETVIAFLALFLLESGVSEMRTLGLLAAIYLATGLAIRLHRLHLGKHPRIVPVALMVLATAGSIATLASPTPESLVLAAFGILTLKDLATTSAIGDIHRAAERIGSAPSQLVSTGMLIGAILVMAALWGSGQILTISPNTWAALVALFCAGFLVMLLRGGVKISGSRAGREVPQLARLYCYLSMTYNATSFVGKRFVLPLAIAQMARGLGLGADAYMSLGVVLSLLVLLGLATRGLSGTMGDPRVMMFGGFFTGLSLWLVLGLLLGGQSVGWMQACFSMICLLVIEISNKVWTLGFVECLRRTARQEGSEDAADVELACFGFFMEVKGYGAGLGFLVAMAALTLEFSALGPAACLGLLLGAGIWMQTQPRMPAVDTPDPTRT